MTEALERLVQLYDDWGKPDQAAEWRANALVPSSRDSGERQALRQIVLQWTWDATATTA